MKKPVQWIVIAAGVIALAGAFFYFRAGAPRQAEAPAPRPSVSVKATPSELADTAPRSVAPDPLLDALADALGSKDVGRIRDAANAVRQKAIHDPEYLRALGAAVTEGGRSMETREVAALILGTIQNPEATKLLVASMAKVSDPGLLRCIVNAIGSWKEPDDHKSFGGLDNPSVVEHASGLQIMVKTQITDPAAVAALLDLMKTTGDDELRTDVARALRLSLDQERVRAAFLDAVVHGYDLKTTAQLGSALSGWAAAQPDERSPETTRVVDVLLGLAEKPEQANLRFLSEASLGGMTLSKAELDKTAAVLQKSKDFDVRYWAMSMMNRQARVQTGVEREAVKTICLSAITVEREGKLRELAAQGLGNMPEDPAASGALLATVQQDPEWNVRDAAAEALGGQINQPAVIATLEKVAAEDPNETVRQTAAKSLAQVREREPGVRPETN